MDDALGSYVISGFTKGVHTLVSTTEMHTKECKNLLTALIDTEATDELILEERINGSLSGP